MILLFYILRAIHFNSGRTMYKFEYSVVLALWSLEQRRKINRREMCLWFCFICFNIPFGFNNSNSTVLMQFQCISLFLTLFECIDAIFHIWKQAVLCVFISFRITLCQQNGSREFRIWLNSCWIRTTSRQLLFKSWISHSGGVILRKSLVWNPLSYDAFFFSLLLFASDFNVNKSPYPMLKRVL